jgi:hypothetical protein
MTVLFSRLDQPLDFSLSQVFTGTQFSVWATARRNCSIFVGWRYQPQL